MKTKTKWKTAPISPTCEKFRIVAGQCDCPTEFAYPAMGGGWMALCCRHGLPHLPYAAPIEELIATGETFA